MDGLRPEQLCVLFRWFKEGPPGAIPIEHGPRSLGLLQAVTWEDAGSAAVERLAAWHGWPADAARRWLVERVLPTPDRVLFWVKDVGGAAVGHVGLSRLDAEKGTIAICDVLCGVAGGDRLFAAALPCLAAWLGRSLKLGVCGECERFAA